MRQDLPDPYVEEALDDVELIALPETLEPVREAIRLSGSLFEYAATRPGARELAGRGIAYHIPAPDGSPDERWMVRHYRRGGLIGRFLEDRYLDTGPRRPVRELIASARARERGVRTPDVLASAVYPVGAWYRADLVTRYLPDSRDLASSVFDEPDPEARRHAMALAGALVRTAHEAGVVHNDLNLRNILIVGGTEGWLLDLDRALVTRDGAAAFERKLMLRRFARSLRKFERERRRPLVDGEREAFAAAYARADAPGIRTEAANESTNEDDR